MTKHIFYSLFWALLIVACSRYPANVERVLKHAGDNRAELEKVLEHYNKRRKDKLKYKAACFLIENMPYYYSSSSKRLDLFDSKYFDRLNNQVFFERIYNDLENDPEILYRRVKKIWDETINEIGNPKDFELKKLQDHKIITAEFLIENIDYAFEAYLFPWARQLSFEQFCEFVLPYRVADEPLESWRPYFMNRYQWMSDSLKNPSDPVEVSILINKDISTWFFGGKGTMYREHGRELTASQLTKCKISSCMQQASLACFAMRSMGLAVAHVNVPQWGNRSMMHDFNAVISKEGKFVDFLCPSLPPGTHFMNDSAPKITMTLFSVNKENIKHQLSIALDKRNVIDVTDSFVATAQVTLDISHNKNIKEIYLCVFNNKDWIPVARGRLRNNVAIFDSMGKDIIYTPLFIGKDLMKFYGMPFFLAKDESVKTFIPDTNNEREGILYKKYPIPQKLIRFANNMIGAKIQGANNPDFINAIDLYTITTTPDSYFKFHSVPKGRYRYVRYLFPEFNRVSAVGNIAELGYKGLDENNREVVLKGKFIGCPEANEIHLEILTDNDLDNYLYIGIADKLVPETPDRVITIPYIKPIWIGMDLKKEYMITQVGFCPRNDTNCIYDHCEYELFYWNKEWFSLGKRTQQKDSLVYSNIPSNALLLLRNYTEGKEERVFSMYNGKQVFY